MLKCEKTSNNEEAESANLLTLESADMPTIEREGEICLEEKEVEEALNSPTDLFEKQALNYFSGYICKVLKRLHGGECETCDKYCCKITAETSVVTEEELFTFLKRYDNDSSSLYSPSEDFVTYVKKISFLVCYCMDKHLSRGSILKSIKSTVMSKLKDPGFCTASIKEKISGHVTKTIFFYNLKKLNESVKTNGVESQQSQRKLKILKNM